MNKKFLIGCGVLAGLFLLIGLIVFIFIYSSYNSMVTLDEGVKEKWSQVENAYQRRMDLIPNLIETVKGYAAHERETLENITQARSKAGGTFQLSEQALKNPAAFAQFQQAQDGLSSALSRLMVVVERYPDLKANQNFLSLQDQLEGTENRIAVERKRFNEAAKAYNIHIKQFPRKMIAGMFGFTEKPYFQAREGADTAPKVKF